MIRRAGLISYDPVEIYAYLVVYCTEKKHNIFRSCLTAWYDLGNSKLKEMPLLC